MQITFTFYIKLYHFHFLTTNNLHSRTLGLADQVRHFPHGLALKLLHFLTQFLVLPKQLRVRRLVAFQTLVLPRVVVLLREDLHDLVLHLIEVVNR